MSETARAGVQSALANSLARVAARDEVAIREFYQAHSNGLYRFILRRVGGCREDAEELTQDTFLAAVRLSATFEGRSTVFVWLCSIAKTQIARHYRDRNRLKQIPQDKLVYEDEDTLRLFQDAAQSVDFPERIIARNEAQEIMHVMMATLADDEREALLLHYVEQMSAAEIGQVLQRSEKGVRNLLTRAKQKAIRRSAGWRERNEYV